MIFRLTKLDARDLADIRSFIKAPDPNLMSSTRASRFSAAFFEIIDAGEEAKKELNTNFQCSIETLT